MYVSFARARQNSVEKRLERGAKAPPRAPARLATSPTGKKVGRGLFVPAPIVSHCARLWKHELAQHSSLLSSLRLVNEVPQWTLHS